MAILETDIKLLASERMNDDADGGGFMTTTVIPDGVENNVFQDISDADRTFGRVQILKVYGAVTSADDDTYLGAHVILDETPLDPAATALMVSKAGYTQERADIVGALDTSSYKVAVGASAHVMGQGPYTAGVSNSFPVPMPWYLGYGYSSYIYPTYYFRPGDLIGIFSKGWDDPIPALSEMEVAIVESFVLATATFSTSGGTGPNNAQVLTLSEPIQRSYTNNTDTTGLFDFIVKLTQDTGSGALKFYGQAVTTGALAIANTAIPIDDAFKQYIPVAEGGAYPTIDPEILGVDPTNYSNTGGKVKVFRENDAAVIHHTIDEAPQTVTNGQDINLGRIRLAKVRVFGSNGVEITAGWTANRTTGHIVFNDVTGYSQPVVIQHRIEDMLLVTTAAETALTVARGVTHAFPAGSKVSSVLMFGDMQARVHNGFQQTTWTSVWSDTLIGTAPLADYNEPAHPIVVTNAGAISDRWAVIFTSSTGFRVIGEEAGEVVAAGAGSTALDTAPINPATGQPYFTIPSTGWGTGWSVGNVYRFNTDGANAPIWLIRSIAPSDPFEGQDRFSVALRGNVDA